MYGNVFQGASKIIGVRTRGVGAEGPWFPPRFHKEGTDGIWPCGCIDLSHLCDL